MSIPTTPASGSPSSVGDTATLAVTGADGSPVAAGGSVTATHPAAHASSPVTESPRLATE